MNLPTAAVKQKPARERQHGGVAGLHALFIARIREVIKPAASEGAALTEDQSGLGVPITSDSTLASGSSSATGRR